MENNEVTEARQRLDEALSRRAEEFKKLRESGYWPGLTLIGEERAEAVKPYYEAHKAVVDCQQELLNTLQIQPNVPVSVGSDEYDYWLAVDTNEDAKNFVPQEIFNAYQDFRELRSLWHSYLSSVQQLFFNEGEE